MIIVGCSESVAEESLDVASLTLCQGVINAEAAQDLINIAGVEESVSFHHHLKGL